MQGCDADSRSGTTPVRVVRECAGAGVVEDVVISIGRCSSLELTGAKLPGGELGKNSRIETDGVIGDRKVVDAVVVGGGVERRIEDEGVPADPALEIVVALTPGCSVVSRSAP